MDWVKKNWIVMVCGVVGLAGIGLAVWAIMGFKDVQTKANNIAAIGGTLSGLRGGATNLTAIDKARAYYTKANASTDEASRKAKALNARKPLRDDVFPVPLTADAPYSFRNAYRAAFHQLPEELKAEKAPTGDIVDRIVGRMEEKARREANVTTVGDQLHIPKPPDVAPYESPLVATAGAAPSFGGRGFDERGGRGYDRGGYDRGGYDRGGYDRGGYDRAPAMPSPVVRPGVPGTLGASQPHVKLPTHDELVPQAKLIATYETARRIWTYIDDESLDMHPIGSPSFVQAPDSVDMWSAQMFYWIEKDIIDALHKVNADAAASLPADQQWVAYLPVKHLVSLRISDYLSGGMADMSGRTSSVAILHRNSQPNVMPRTSSGGRLSMGSTADAFTGRTSNDQYDVVHVCAKRGGQRLRSAEGAGCAVQAELYHSARCAVSKRGRSQRPRGRLSVRYRAGCRR